MTSKSNPIEQARYIFTTGKIIRDRVDRILTADLSSGKIHRVFGELSVPQFHVLMVIRSWKQVTIKQLAELLCVSPPSASAMVDRLVEKGILTREQSREDRRKVMVQVSTTAMKHLEKVERTVLQSFVDLVEKVGPETANQWCAVLERVRSVLEDEGEVISPAPKTQ